MWDHQNVNSGEYQRIIYPRVSQAMNSPKEVLDEASITSKEVSFLEDPEMAEPHILTR